MYDLIDYKGKFEIIQDKDKISDTFDYICGSISHKNAINYIKSNYELSRYYGVPIYIGSNKELKRLVNKLEREYNKQ